MKCIKLKINNVNGYSGVVSVSVNEDNLPLSKFWRQRLNDATIDKCVEILTPKQNRSKKRKVEK